MENSSKFFSNKDCQYYPCHKCEGDINCLFCYCPFYSWEICPGENKYKEKPDGKRIKVCTDCSFPHQEKNYDKVIEILKLGREAYANTKGTGEKRSEAHAIKREALDTKLYGIGVGPGDGALITRQAERIIRAVDVLILPAKDKDSCRAYNITAQVIPEIADKECMFIPFPMSMKEPELSTFHRDVATQIERLLDENKSVGFLTIGDVSIYSTFAYIDELVKNDGYNTHSISGISSFSAAASRLGIPLTLGSEELHIIPGSGDVDEALSLSGTLVFMKSGKRLAELKEKLIILEKDKKSKVYAVSNCGMENETTSIGAENISDESGYLTVVIVKNKSN